MLASSDANQLAAQKFKTERYSSNGQVQLAFASQSRPSTGTIVVVFAYAKVSWTTTADQGSGS